MRKVLAMTLIACATVGGGAAMAHPTDVPYQTRGECERASAASAKEDRERLVARGIFPTLGAAQSTFHEDWRCEYDDEQKAWFIVDYRFR